MNTRSFLPLVVAATLAHADVLPPVQDSSSSKGKLTAATGRATSLPVTATRKGFVLFNLNSLPLDVLPGDIANARLRVFFPAAKTPGDIAVHTVTAAWDEVSTAPEPGVSAAAVAMFPVAMVGKKKFLEVDVTTTVRAWRAAPATNFGFAFLAASPASVTIGAKEGSGSGYPCELEVQIDRATADGSIGALQLADGAVTMPKLADGAVSALKLGAGAAQQNLDAGVPVGLGLGGAAARATLELGGGPSFFAPRQLTVLRDGVGGFSRLTLPRSIAISGTTAVVAASHASSGVTVLDISNPAQPVLKAELVDGSGGFDELAGAHRVTMSGSLAFIASQSDNAVTIVDLADPASPVLKAVLKSGVGGYDFGIRVTDIAVSGDLLAITNYASTSVSDAVTFVDISNPAAPLRVSALRDNEGGFNRLDGAAGVALSTLPGLGLHAIVPSVFDSAVTIIDVNDPANPMLRAELVDGGGGFEGLALAGGVSAEGALIAVSAFLDDAVSLIDISTPTAPVLRAELRDGVGGFSRLDAPSFPTLASGRLYIPARNEESLTIVDVSNPAAPVLLAELVDGAGGFDGLAYDQDLNVAVTPAGHVFVPASGESAVSVIETQPQVSLAVQQRMGIGTATPGAELEVVGTAKATAFSGDGSALTNLNAANLGTGSVNNTELGFLDGVTSGIQPQLNTLTTNLGTTNTNVTNLTTTVSGKVSKAGDTMTGALNLPANGLAVGGTQLVASGGMVGIGTSSPDRPLAIKAAGGNGEWVSFKDSSDVTRWHLNHSFGGLDFVQTGVADLRLFLSNNGNVGIGRIPATSRLEVEGAVSATSFTGLNNAPLELRTSGVRGLLLENAAGSINVSGGWSGNFVSPGAAGGTVAGGGDSTGPNDVQGNFGTVGGGRNNHAAATGATVVGGRNNFANGNDATVAGGNNNNAAGDHSFAAGKDALAFHSGAFVWGDGTGFTESSASNEFTVRASGGTRFFTDAGILGVSLAPNATSWSTISDQNAKKNFQPVDTEAVLDRLAAVPVQRWNYKGEPDAAVPHLGPMAQAFKAAFYPGRDDKTITTLEFDGVALAAIQGLNAKLERENAELRKRIERLEQMLTK